MFNLFDLPHIDLREPNLRVRPKASRPFVIDPSIYEKSHIWAPCYAQFLQWRRCRGIKHSLTAATEFTADQWSVLPAGHCRATIITNWDIHTCQWSRFCRVNPTIRTTKGCELCKPCQKCPFWGLFWAFHGQGLNIPNLTPTSCQKNGSRPSYRWCSTQMPSFSVQLLQKSGVLHSYLTLVVSIVFYIQPLLCI